MRHRVLRSVLLALPLLATASLSARADLSLSGFVSGVEVCPQSACGAAIFIAGLAGQIDDRTAVGVALGGIEQDPLPDIGAFADITGGRRAIRTLRRTVERDIAGGTIFNFDGARYAIVMTMTSAEGGTKPPLPASWITARFRRRSGDGSRVVMAARGSAPGR